MRTKYNLYTGVTKVKNRFLQKANRFAAGVVSVLAISGLALMPVAHAAPTVVVTPSNTQGWTNADTRPGGAVNYVADNTAPGTPNTGALQLTTNNTDAAKAQYLHATNTPLSSVNELSYSTKSVSGAVVADPSYQVGTCLGGVAGGICVGFANLVFEPYWNGTVTQGSWQNWDVLSGQLWSSGNYAAGTCTVQKGAGGPPFYSIASLKTDCPNAVVVGFGVNVGSYNPNYNVEADLVDFNGTVYNFELYYAVTDKNACKDSDWKTATDANGNSFKNQGACVSYVASHGKSQH